jgi:preprotein translocase SecF subunit
LGHAEIQQIEGGKELMVKLKKSEDSVGQMSNHLVEILNKALPENDFKVIGKSEIGASISGDLRSKAMVAIIISMLGIIIYIAWRFEFIFGIGATIATFHDVLAVMGVFYLFNVEITLLVVTALLTLAGYSLTDTVVVFDRIRENLAGAKQTGRDHLSVNEVLSRTIITSTTVFGGGGPVLLRRRGPERFRPGHDLRGPGGHLFLHLCGQPHRLCLAERGQTGGGETGKGRGTGGPETEARR